MVEVRRRSNDDVSWEEVRQWWSRMVAEWRFDGDGQGEVQKHSSGEIRMTITRRRG